jgi:hypothetical protein
MQAAVSTIGLDIGLTRDTTPGTANLINTTTLPISDNLQILAERRQLR